MVLGFGYESNAIGNITEWVRKLASAQDETFAFAYDDASQLTEAVLTRYGVGTPLADRDFTYDLGGNVAESGGDAPFYNSVNELKGFGDAVPTTISGTTNKASMVTVNGEAATTGYESAYEVELDLPVGPISLTINAVTAASESKTSVWKYEVLPEDAFLYDENGNLTDDGTRTYEWDAEDRLVGIQETSSGNRSEFVYDGFSRRVKMVEKTGLTTDSDRRYVWDGLSVAESRMPDGETVEKSYFGEGFKAGSDAYYYTSDHLGSIRGLVDASDVERGRWDFGPWGERSANLVTSSPVEVDFGYTGHWNHARSGLALAPYRAYSSEHKRWISRDPIEEYGGINLYTYVLNSPINNLDPLGLIDWSKWGMGSSWKNRGDHPVFAHDYDNNLWYELHPGEESPLGADIDYLKDGPQVCKMFGGPLNQALSLAPGSFDRHVIDDLRWGQEKGPGNTRRGQRSFPPDPSNYLP